MSRARSLKQYLLLYAIGFLALVTVAGGMGGYALYFWHQSSRETLRLNSMIQQVQEMRGSLYLQLKEVFDAIFLADSEAVKQYYEYEQRIQTHLNRLDNIAHGPDERAALNGLRKSYQGVRDVGANVLRADRNMPMAEKQRLLNTELEMRGINNHEEAIKKIESLLRVQQAQLDRRLSKLNQLVPALLALPFLLALGLLIFSRFFLQRAVVAPLAALERATAKISAGQLDERVPLYGPSELRSLANKVNAMAHDLAESRQSLLRAEKQATLGALMPVLAHNIRNPIAAIRATAQVISDPALSAETKEEIAGIISTADRLERWTSSLLSYLHPMKPQLSAVDLNKLLDSVLHLCRLRIDNKQLSVDRAGDPAATGVSLDVELMEQALQGLIVNAIEASPPQGKLTLRVACSADHVKIHVLDEGAGMPFAPVTAGLTPGPTTKRYGTGLGIPFALRVIDAHGGAVQFISRSPRGTEVIVSIPRRHDGEIKHDVVP
jgi:signal transduction histidine kinase